MREKVREAHTFPARSSTSAEPCKCGAPPWAPPFVGPFGTVWGIMDRNRDGCPADW